MCQYPEGVTRNHCEQLMEMFYSSKNFPAIDLVHRTMVSDWSIQPSRETYCLLLNIFSSIGVIQKTREIIDTLITKGLHPTVNEYNELAKVLAKTCDSNEIDSLRLLMKVNYVFPDERTLFFCGKGYFFAQDPKNLLDIRNALLTNYPNSVEAKEIQEDYNTLKRELLL